MGSNKGDRFKFLIKAVESINEIPGCNILSISSVYETKPLGNMEQNNFLNAVMKIETSFSPIDLFKELKTINQD